MYLVLCEHILSSGIGMFFLMLVLFAVGVFLSDHLADFVSQTW